MAVTAEEAEGAEATRPDSDGPLTRGGFCRKDMRRVRRREFRLTPGGGLAYPRQWDT
jgi:hypothetical protein